VKGACLLQPERQIKSRWNQATVGYGCMQLFRSFFYFFLPPLWAAFCAFPALLLQRP
jgi:hypothetical protein